MKKKCVWKYMKEEKKEKKISYFILVPLYFLTVFCSIIELKRILIIIMSPVIKSMKNLVNKKQINWWGFFKGMMYYVTMLEIVNMQNIYYYYLQIQTNKLNTY